MNVDDLLAGESKNIEYKEAFLKSANKYLKTVVAYANGRGGKIIFGINDKRQVVGIETDSIFKVMDAITNTIADSCEPVIIPDISLQTILDKTIIVVEIGPGRQKPYFIKSLGRSKGVYIRTAGTSRPADDYMIKELMFEGSNKFFDQTPIAGLCVTNKEIEELCLSLKESAMKNSKSENEKSEIKAVTTNTLLSWSVLVEREGEYLPTNAYALLTGVNLHAICVRFFKF